MATREERTAAYREVIVALADAARIDGFMERTAIAKAMDALGCIISDVDPHVVAQAIAFRNGPLLRDHQPVDTYLQRDPDLVPVEWVFPWCEVMLWKCTDSNLRNELIHEAHRRAHDAGSLTGYTSTWCGKVELENGYFAVTLYPDLGWADRHKDDPEPEQTPEGLLPTALVPFGDLLGAIDVRETVELTITELAKTQLYYGNPYEHDKLTDSWWAKVEVTESGYLATFHYSREGPGDE